LKKYLKFLSFFNDLNYFLKEQLNMDALEIKLDNQVLNDELEKFKISIEEKDQNMKASEHKLSSLNEQIVRQKFLI